jgi:hypothetical protein
MSENITAIKALENNNEKCVPPDNFVKIEFTTKE